ncbi:hypothetical protein [Staphylococcus phage Stab21]|jgi:hypothetical protein|uniref:UboB n=22 Tax=Kayvirus TaxID=1857843 RepID=I6XJW7_9CAUD|nr:hypothetical protein [Staphylococcus aureus]YP_008873525.1 hypothetical protein X920_gp005 [Staphylococcus phage Sb1]YP_009098157.1 hypothetical protein QLX38_gp023 [Staphylococcus phage Team1]YP_009195844.1 hypothetical protein AVU41_gp008 [Staphylococcus phage phiIPLA-RODI]YP_009780217.1 hypothetical protein QLX23_gp156 [Staphylococcus phage ISP]YP_009780363.1 hypothetical protein QLX37_gp090 [Staphylococcus phage SA5]YP_009780942.1 UboB [Staphylococcus phage 676Z]YP_009781175.1 UboB [S
MGLDFEVIGVTLSNRKVEQKGLQHFINNARYRHILEKNYYKGFNFEDDFRKPGYFMDLLLRDAETYYDEFEEWCEGVFVLTKDKLVNLMKNEFNEKTFKGTHDAEYYYRLMSHIYNVEQYEGKFYDFYLIMSVNV